MQYTASIAHQQYCYRTIVKRVDEDQAMVQYNVKVAVIERNKKKEGLRKKGTKEAQGVES